jgi:transcriptional regulator with PAS, ATPase and Fis domain
VIGASIYDFLDQKNASIMRKQMEEKRDKGVSSIYELSILSKSGLPIPVLVSGSPIYSGDRITGKIGVLKDFREQSSLRLELQQSLDYIETIMDSIPDELIVIDRNYKILMSNKIAATHAERELTGELCHEAMHSTSVPCWTEGHECPSRRSSRPAGRKVHQHVDREGRMRYHEILASPVRTRQAMSCR